MGNISIETPSGPLNFKISGDRPSRTETIRINQYLRKYNRDKKTNQVTSIGIPEEQEQFDTTTGIKDAKLRAALSGMENISEQNKTMGAFGFESKDYTRDSRNRLALTPSGAKKMGIETDKNILIDESGFSRYDLADLAGIVPEVGLAVPGAVKGAGIELGTELTQTEIERLQAGLDSSARTLYNILTKAENEELSQEELNYLAEYLEVSAASLFAGGIISGSVKGAAAVTEKFTG